MRARSTPVTNRCVPHILNWRASTSQHTQNCCGSAHAYGEKGGETAMSMKTTSESRGLSIWTPEFVQVSLEWLALRAALAQRRAIWLTRLFDASLVWREPGDSRARLLVIEKGEVALNAAPWTQAHRHRCHRVSAVPSLLVVRPSLSPPSIACGY